MVRRPPEPLSLRRAPRTLPVRRLHRGSLGERPMTAVRRGLAPSGAPGRAAAGAGDRAHRAAPSVRPCSPTIRSSPASSGRTTRDSPRCIRSSPPWSSTWDRSPTPPVMPRCSRRSPASGMPPSGRGGVPAARGRLAARRPLAAASGPVPHAGVPGRQPRLGAAWMTDPTAQDSGLVRSASCGFCSRCAGWPRRARGPSWTRGPERSRCRPHRGEPVREADERRSDVPRSREE